MTRIASGSSATQSYRMERVPVFVEGVQLDVADRTSDEDLRTFHERYKGTDKIMFGRFVFMTGHEVFVMMRSSDIDLRTPGRILIAGVMPNGSDKVAVPVAIVGSLFNSNGGWLKIEKTFQPHS